MKHLSQRVIKITLLYSLFVFIQTIYSATINFRGNSSYLHVLPNANFVVNQPMSSVGGSLIRDSGGIISGSNVTFSGGLLQDMGNSMLLNAVFAPAGAAAGSLTLNGGTNSIKQSSGVINQSLTISGVGARVEGSPVFNGPITLQDSNTTATFAIQSDLLSNITFNGSILNLDDTLKFADGASYVGTGTNPAIIIFLNI